MVHAHLEVDLRGGEFGGDFCLPRAGRWRTDPFKGTLVIGRGVPRTEIPLVNINAIRLTDAQWCRYQPNPEPPVAPPHETGMVINSWEQMEPLDVIQVDPESYTMGTPDKPIIIDADPRWRVLRELDPSEYDHVHVNGECVKNRWGTACPDAVEPDQDKDASRYCFDCPDKEACSTGMSCEFVKQNAMIDVDDDDDDDL